MLKKNIFYQIAKRFLYFYPFTIAGTVLLICAVILLSDAFINLNPYSFVLAVSAFILLLLTALLSRIQAENCRQLPCEWDSTLPLYAGAEDQRQVVYCEGLRTMPFFRLHFRLKGRFYVAAKESFLYYREFSSSQPEKLEFLLYFPLCGSLQAAGYLLIKDILGLSQARFTKAMPRTIYVRPPLIQWEADTPLLTMDGLEDTIRKKDTSEERYYQREYMAGDKLRDINWKASERFAALITKVSHITQEKTRLLTIFLRNYRTQTRESIESLVHLNVIKGWLLSFVKAVKQAYPDYNFEIITGQDKITIETEEDIERLSISLSTLAYDHSNNHMPVTHPGEVFIFSTPYDVQLPRLVSDLRESQVQIFRTVAGSPAQTSAKHAAAMRFSLLRPLPHVSLPGFWILNREKQLRTVALRRTDSLSVYEKQLSVKLL
ncbi:MAG: DUF58 domain-containing protein [Spirochaetales bacterium]|nr:DUF58 domain-containing protein [Spirochaetales bacterium]